MSNQYKIGEFSKYMGVTPDFLKHYEQYGLIQPYTTESNYRYYSFEKAAEIIECVRFKNWGFSLKEMKNLIQDADLDEIMDSYRSKIDEMQKTIHYYQVLIDEFYRFEKFITSLNEHWTIEYIDEAVFLPHSNNRDFLENPNIYRIMEQWTKWMPVVHSCQRIYDCFDENKQPYSHWGYSVLKQFADENELLTCEPCEIIPKRKCLVIKNSISDSQKNSRINETINSVNSILEEYGFVPDGEILRIVYQYSHEDGVITQHSTLIVPLKD